MGLRVGLRVGLPGLLLVVLAVVASACSGAVEADEVRTAGGPVLGLTVSGASGEQPAVRIVAPLDVTESRSEVLVAGTGEPVRSEELVVLHLALYSARTGAKALSTYDGPSGPLVAKPADGTLLPALAEELVGLRQGSRLVMALTAREALGPDGSPPAGLSAEDPLVVVADVIAVPPATVLEGPDGPARPPEPGQPRVVLEGSEPVRLELGTALEPDDVVVVPLIEGSGPAVQRPGLVTVDFLAQGFGSQGFGSQEPFDSTFFKEPVVVPVGAAGSVPAWDEALVGLRRGSRVLVIAPAAKAREPGSPGGGEHATIAWIVDILGVS